MNEETHKKVLEINPDVLFSELEGEAVLLHTKTERYFGLDEVGVRFYQAVLEHKEFAASADILCQHYGVPREQIEKDLSVLLDDMEKAGIVSRSEK